MASVLFDVVVDGAELEDALKAMGRSPAALAPTFAVIAEDLVAGVVDRIDSRGDGEWPDLAASTIAAKGSDAPLIDRGQLRNSMRPSSGDDWAMASTGTAYVVYHLDGGPKIPKRNPFELQPAIFEDAARMIADAVARGA